MVVYTVYGRVAGRAGDMPMMTQLGDRWCRRVGNTSKLSVFHLCNAYIRLYLRGIHGMGFFVRHVFIAPLGIIRIAFCLGHIRCYCLPSLDVGNVTAASLLSETSVCLFMKVSVLRDGPGVVLRSLTAPSGLCTVEWCHGLGSRSLMWSHRS